MSAGLAIVIQCFIKTDTLQRLTDSLLRCFRRDEFHLIFWSDLPVPSMGRPENAALHATMLGFLQSFRKDHGGQFASCNIYRNNENRGTCRTCEVALDFAFSQHDFAIFAEDDCVFSADALDWFLKCRDTAAFAGNDAWAITGESIFFDSQREAVTPDFIAAARDFALARGLHGKYVPAGFLPSTCFATSKVKWRDFGATRGQPRGDYDVCVRCREEGKFALFPVVARVKDIGMLHDLGYSVMIHSKDGVKEVKNVYLMAEDLLPGMMQAPPEELPEKQRGEIFARSVKLLGFAPPADAALAQREPSGTINGYAFAAIQRQVLDRLADCTSSRIRQQLDRVEQSLAAASTPILLSIGENCAPAIRLRDAGLPDHQTGFFDNIVAPLDSVIALLERDFADLLALQDLEIGRWEGQDSVFNTKYRIFFHHYFYLRPESLEKSHHDDGRRRRRIDEADIPLFLPLVMAQFGYLIEKLRLVLRAPRRKILMLRRVEGAPVPEAMSAWLTAALTHFGARDFEFLAVHSGGFEDGVVYDHAIHRLIPEAGERWGNAAAWRAVFETALA